MRRSLLARIGTVILVASLATPVFAAPRDDSPFGPIERVFARVVHQLKKVFMPGSTDTIGYPKP